MRRLDVRWNKNSPTSKLCSESIYPQTHLILCTAGDVDASGSGVFTGFRAMLTPSLTRPLAGTETTVNRAGALAHAGLRRSEAPGLWTPPSRSRLPAVAPAPVGGGRWERVLKQCVAYLSVVAIAGGIRPIQPFAGTCSCMCTAARPDLVLGPPVPAVVRRRSRLEYVLVLDSASGVHGPGVRGPRST
jgi:hypothetical protein